MTPRRHVGKMIFAVLKCGLGHSVIVIELLNENRISKTDKLTKKSCTYSLNSIDVGNELVSV